VAIIIPLIFLIFEHMVINTNSIPHLSPFMPRTLLPLFETYKIV
jgi:hypothetical protein